MALDLPDPLLESMSEGRLVLFAGAGLSVAATCRAGELLEQMLQWTRDQSIVLASPHAEIEELIKDGELLLAAHTLRSQMGEPNFHRFIQNVFRSRELAPGPLHQFLPFASRRC